MTRFRNGWRPKWYQIYPGTRWGYVKWLVKQYVEWWKRRP